MMIVSFPFGQQNVLQATGTGIIDRVCIAGDHLHICFRTAGFYSYDDMTPVWLMAASAICMEFRT